MSNLRHWSDASTKLSVSGISGRVKHVLFAGIPIELNPAFADLDISAQISGVGFGALKKKAVLARTRPLHRESRQYAFWVHDVNYFLVREISQGEHTHWAADSFPTPIPVILIFPLNLKSLQNLLLFGKQNSQS